MTSSGRLRVQSSPCSRLVGGISRILVLSIILLAYTSSRSSLVSAIPSPPRWIYPCSGGLVVEGLGEDVSGLVLQSSSGGGGFSEESELEAAIDAMRDWAQTLHTLTDRTVRLKRRVRELKNLYVRYRFRDESLVQDLEQMGLRLEGMPSITEATVGSVNNENMVATLHTAFEYLARVAVFLEQARIGENLALNENVSFENEFRLLEDDHETGIYWLLCALHRVIYVTGRHVGQHVIDDVMRTRVVEVDRNALRHTRDFIVLRDFERLLDRLSIDFAGLRNLRPIF